MTALFGDVIFGPVRSRRLGTSLGVNLLPVSSKLCNFNCIYCECGWTEGAGGRFNSRGDVRELLRAKLETVPPPDTITFAGNGEPTMHPEFEAIIDDVVELRNNLCPATKISVLSNGTMIGRESVRRALSKVDNNILKLDSAIDATVNRINDPLGRYSVAEVIENMKLFGGELIVQTMFLRGAGVDNTTPEEVSAWLDALRQIRPQEVMVYTIDRDTPMAGLEKVSEKELAAIRELANKKLKIPIL